MRPRYAIEYFLTELVFRLKFKYAPDRLEYTSVQAWKDDAKRDLAIRLCHQIQALKENGRI